MTETTRILRIEDPMHSVKFASAVQDFNTYEKFTDICFVCQKGVKVKAHKLLLCSLSHFMKNMFLALPDFVWHETITINIPDVDSGTMHLVLDFLYEGSIKVSEPQMNRVQDVLKLLNIVLENKDTPKPPPCEVQPPVLPQQPQQQVVYLPTTPNSQGQMQYVVAQQAQGQVMASSGAQSQATWANNMIMTQANHGATLQPGSLMSAAVQPAPQPSPEQSNNPQPQLIQVTGQVMSAQNGFPQQAGVPMVPGQPGMPGQPVMINTNNMPVHMQTQDNYIVRAQQQQSAPTQQVRPQPSSQTRPRTPQVMNRSNSTDECTMPKLNNEVADLLNSIALEDSGVQSYMNVIDLNLEQCQDKSSASFSDGDINLECNIQSVEKVMIAKAAEDTRNKNSDKLSNVLRKHFSTKKVDMKKSSVNKIHEGRVLKKKISSLKIIPKPNSKPNSKPFFDQNKIVDAVLEKLSMMGASHLFQQTNLSVSNSLKAPENKETQQNVLNHCTKEQSLPKILSVKVKKIDEANGDTQNAPVYKKKSSSEKIYEKSSSPTTFNNSNKDLIVKEKAVLRSMDDGALTGIIKTNFESPKTKSKVIKEHSKVGPINCGSTTESSKKKKVCHTLHKSNTDSGSTSGKKSQSKISDQEPETATRNISRQKFLSSPCRASPELAMIINGSKRCEIILTRKEAVSAVWKYAKENKLYNYKTKVATAKCDNNLSQIFKRGVIDYGFVYRYFSGPNKHITDL